MSVRRIKVPLRESWRARLPPLRDPIASWLSVQGSLTEQLRSACRNFEVRVLRQASVFPRHDERALLGLARGTLVSGREVLLVADGIPVVFARSLVLLRHRRGGWHRWQSLGCRPLGELLFDDPQIHRGGLHYRRFKSEDGRQLMVAAGLSGFGRLWGRRRLFSLGGKPLLLTELFLPEIVRLKP